MGGGVVRGQWGPVHGQHGAALVDGQKQDPGYTEFDNP